MKKNTRKILATIGASGGALGLAGGIISAGMTGCSINIKPQDPVTGIQIVNLKMILIEQNTKYQSVPLQVMDNNNRVLENGVDVTYESSGLDGTGLMINLNTGVISGTVRSSISGTFTIRAIGKVGTVYERMQSIESKTLNVVNKAYLSDGRDWNGYTGGTPFNQENWVISEQERTITYGNVNNLGYEATDLQIPRYVKTIENIVYVLIIGQGMLAYNTLITGSLTINDGHTSIGSYAFRDCTNLDGQLILPTSITHIGVEAFQSTAISGELVLYSSIQFMDRPFWYTSSIDTITLSGFDELPIWNLGVVFFLGWASTGTVRVENGALGSTEALLYFQSHGLPIGWEAE